jgi:2-polyprenyl-3-methyl-5-hydroxy-6-metoxy-1,4-benzoquinol methylase
MPGRHRHVRLQLMRRGVSGRVIRCLLKQGGLNAAETRALGAETTTLQGNRQETLKTLRGLAEEWLIPEQQTLWSRYDDIERFSERLELSRLQLLPISDGQNRNAAVFGILEQYRPARVVDLGAGAGFFSLLAHKAGSAVVAIDNDETAIERFYQYLRAHPIGGNVEMSVRDLFSNDPLPKGDCVLALALCITSTSANSFPSPS